MLFGLLYGGHYFFAIYFPENGLSELRDAAQVFLFLLFLKSHLLSKFFGKKFEILPGQISLGFSVVKLIFAGSFIMVCKKLLGYNLSNSFILLFMGSYFLYQGLDVIILLKDLNKKEPV